MNGRLENLNEKFIKNDNVVTYFLALFRQQQQQQQIKTTRSSNTKQMAAAGINTINKVCFSV